ncbi:MAG: nucleotidyltransferase domain-containing protein [Deltaproteobacteria bacterium]|jgi:predicted nucleotidyltransferase|nr:nucleotidyltransferase domain-containing protein [Deltaproteobacteria bacterium]
MENIKGKTIDEIKGILKKYFQKHTEIEVAYIFGSVTQGRTSSLSDIDIAVITDSQQIKEETYRYGYKAEILTDLIKLLKTNDVDLVILNEVNTLLKHRVLYFGKLIYSKNERKRIAFQTETINKYNDYKQLINPHLVLGGRSD